MATTRPARYLIVEGREIALDPEGFLVDLSAWTPAVADALAAEEGRTLTAEHWEVLEVLRDFYARYENAPAPHHQDMDGQILSSTQPGQGKCRLHVGMDIDARHIS